MRKLEDQIALAEMEDDAAAAANPGGWCALQPWPYAECAQPTVPGSHRFPTVPGYRKTRRNLVLDLPPSRPARAWPTPDAADH